MKLAAMAFVGLMMCGCSKRPSYYRIEVKGGEYTYWKEVNPNTKHGICAAVYGYERWWEVDHPIGSDPKTHMSTHTEMRIFTTKESALAWAESVCPTTKVSVTK